MNISGKKFALLLDVFFSTHPYAEIEPNNKSKPWLRANGTISYAIILNKVSNHKVFVIKQR